MRSHSDHTTEKDIFRETPVRLLGYSNEIGEAFRALVHKNVVRGSYAVAFSYCIADTVHKAINASTKKEIVDNRNGNYYLVFNTALDSFVWQTLASVAIPGFTINRINWFSIRLLTKYSTVSAITSKWTAVAISIASIPVIVKPIDTLVDTILDKSLRRFLSTK